MLAKKWLVLALGLALLLPSCAVTGSMNAPAPSATAAAPTVVQERYDMLMSAAAAAAYVNTGAYPKPGYDIAALVAWNVEDAASTPEFVIERNRNFEYQGDVHHAEVNTIRRAYEKKREFNVPLSTTPQAYKTAFKGATLFTTLEPCPMCAMTMLLASVPKAVYFMEDPGLRDPKTKKTNICLPDEVYQRKLVQEPSTIPESSKANDEMWAATGAADFRITKYLAANARTIFRPSYDRLMGFEPVHQQNRELLEKLRSAIGKPVE